MNNTINRFLAILCYPFASLDFFREDILKKILQCKEQKNREKRWEWEEKLKENVAVEVQKKFSIYSYDEVYLYLGKIYLYDFWNRDYPSVYALYLECFCRMTRAMISQRDGKIVYKYWKNENDETLFGNLGEKNKIFLFHSLNMQLPMDFLTMLYLAMNPQNDVECLNQYYGQIEVADQQLDTVLKKGVAENHLHKGVSMSFAEIWEALMMPLDAHGSEVLRRNCLWKTALCGEENFFYILSTAIVRVWIALRLSGKYDVERFREAEEREGEQGCLVLEGFVADFMDGEKIGSHYAKLVGEYAGNELGNGIIDFFCRLWDSLRALLVCPIQGRCAMREIFDVPSNIHTSEENIFLYKSMKYFYIHGNRGASQKEDALLQLIIQYLRIRNYSFSIIVQAKSIRGLDYFQKVFYGRDSRLNSFVGQMWENEGEESAAAFWKQAMRKQFQNRYLRKIEFRMSIGDKETEFRKQIRAFLSAYRTVIEEDYCQKTGEVYKVVQSFPRVGIVFHLLKKKDQEIPEKCALDGLERPEKNAFGQLKVNYQAQIRLMRKLREEIRGLDRYIVGIDAASLENATPVWVFSQVYDNARDSSWEQMGYDRRKQSLRFTFHAGEDFRHILSGLRRIDEAVTFLKFHAGDRIGHGTALGIVPEEWRQYNTLVVIPRIEALENYVWAYYMLSQDNTEFQATLMAYLERRVYELSQEIYGNGQELSLPLLVKGYLHTYENSFSPDREKCQEMENMGFCEEVRKRESSKILWDSEKIVAARHCKKFLTEMDRPINYEVTEQDILITKELQKILRDKMSKKGIVVEVNPSSNVSIGELDKLADNQIYALNQPGRENNVMVCINSDDPTVFNTNVSNELSYIYYGMLYRGSSRETALEWIDKVRLCGMDSSFIQIEESDQEMYERLKELLIYI